MSQTFRSKTVDSNQMMAEEQKWNEKNEQEGNIDKE